MKFKLTLKHYTIISLISSFLIAFVFSAIYTLGTMTPYIASYIYYEDDPTITVVDVSILYPTYMACQNIGILISMIYLQKILAFKVLGFIGIFGVFICVFVTSFFKSLAAYIILYGILYGVVVGICYMIPMLNTYIYLPQKKGFCSGLYMMAFGIGALLFNNILLKLINPDNLHPTNHIFPKSVAENVPYALKTISIIYLGIGTIGCLLLIPKSTLKLQEMEEQKSFKTKQDQQNNRKVSIITTGQQSSQNESLKQSTKTSQTNQLLPSSSQKRSLSQLLKTSKISINIILAQYKQLFFMIITMMPFGAFIIMNYKEYGQTLTDNDSLLTQTASIGSVTNSISRIFWCYLLDKYSFRSIHLILNSTMILYVILIIFVKNQYLYVVLINLIYFSYGANYGTYPAQTVRLYGDKDGSRIYSVVFIAFSLAAIVQFLFHFFIVKNMGNYLSLIFIIGDSGFLVCFIIFGSLLLIAEVLLFKIDFRQKQKKQNQLNQEK